MLFAGRLFSAMVITMIFAEGIGLYGMIVGMLLNGNAASSGCVVSYRFERPRCGRLSGVATSCLQRACHVLSGHGHERKKAHMGGETERFCRAREVKERSGTVHCGLSGQVKSVDARNDAYSLGVKLLALLCP